jgi:hypothetical protein
MSVLDVVGPRCIQELCWDFVIDGSLQLETFMRDSCAFYVVSKWWQWQTSQKWALQPDNAHIYTERLLRGLCLAKQDTIQKAAKLRDLPRYVLRGIPSFVTPEVLDAFWPWKNWDKMILLRQCINKKSSAQLCHHILVEIPQKVFSEALWRASQSRNSDMIGVLLRSKKHELGFCSAKCKHRFFRRMQRLGEHTCARHATKYTLAQQHAFRGQKIYRAPQSQLCVCCGDPFSQPTARTF